MSTLLKVDFSDLAHGVRVLEEDRADPRQVRAVCLLLLADVQGIAGSAADDFRRIVAACLRDPRRIDDVRPALGALAIDCAGASAAMHVEKERRARAREYGALGGRPPSGHDEEWLRMHDAMKARNPRLSKKRICEYIAASWKDAEGKGRQWTTIRDGVNRERKKADG